MTWPDFFIIAVILLSALVGVWRGLIKESISLATWVLAVWISIRFSSALGALLPDSLSQLMFSLGEMAFRIENLRVGIAMVMLFVLTLIVGSIVSFLLGRLVQMAHFTSVDRALGGLFGLTRGAVLVVGLVLLMGLTTVPTSPSWRDAWLVPPFAGAAHGILGLLPSHISAYFYYGQ